LFAHEGVSIVAVLEGRSPVRSSVLRVLALGCAHEADLQAVPAVAALPLEMALVDGGSGESFGTARIPFIVRQ
jgi:hypothetical protein